ncbi:GNAT family N-acetyltransferase [Nocardioides donggukensis]|uniref:GNAT N-acetyltransferase n=1 Tax=Nocardioides donggukensis TaxID=2774019 RepID=A0A927K8S6_9ACTN|nr:GNAT family N-acetyltransferase [Nocardioides donggukensis]MBD8871073.1 GNAT N-acetyltransferase [Nocardioides donggukensis]
MRYPDDVPVLSDGSVTLRALRLDDVPRVVEQCTDPASITWTTVPVPYDEAEARTWIGRVVPAGWVEGVDLTFAVEHEGAFAGSVSLRPRGGWEAEIGFGLHADARGRGVMRAGLDLLLDWAFADRGRRVVHWRANVGNWASRRVVWSLGFTFGPTVPGLLDHRGTPTDGWTAWLGRDDPRRPGAPWHEVSTLEDGDLRLRAWRDADGAGLVETGRDPVLRRFLPGSPLPTLPEEVTGYLDRVRLGVVTGERLAWCVADRETDAVLGGVALFDLEGPEQAGAAQVGFWSHPAGRGRGVTTRAVRALAGHAFRERPAGLGMRRLYLLTAATNTGAIRVAERAGFAHVGTERKGALVADGFVDNVVYDLLAGESSGSWSSGR